MRLPDSYLINIGKTEPYFDAILNAEPPDRFTYKFLEKLGFTSSNDRLFIGVLRDLGFLDADGVPTERYYQFLDRTQSQRVLAQAIREAYSDLFAVNKNAQSLESEEVANKLRTLYAGSKSDLVITRIAKTFESLCSIADFTSPPKEVPKKEPDREVSPEMPEEQPRLEERPSPRVSLDSLQYHINIVLPETRDQAVYDAIFRSLREHLG